ncbi:MAG: hypothetical protein LBM72_00925 [Mycoplasmataceae bacterium]|nr:hypothetical protein [Mycoplasmataceae bacterium]
MKIKKQNTNNQYRGGIFLFILRSFLTLFVVAGAIIILISWIEFIQLKNPQSLRIYVPAQIAMDSIGWTFIITGCVAGMNLWMYTNAKRGNIVVKPFIYILCWVASAVAVTFLIVNVYLTWGYYDWGYMSPVNLNDAEYQTPFRLFFLKSIYIGDVEHDATALGDWPWATFMVAVFLVFTIISYIVAKVSLANSDFSQNNRIRMAKLSGVVISLVFVFAFVSLYIFLGLTKHSYSGFAHNFCNVLCILLIFMWVIVTSLLFVTSGSNKTRLIEWLFFIISTLLMILLSAIFVMLHANILKNAASSLMIIFTICCVLFCCFASLFTNHVSEINNSKKKVGSPTKKKHSSTSRSSRSSKSSSSQMWM